MRQVNLLTKQFQSTPEVSAKTILQEKALKDFEQFNDHYIFHLLQFLVPVFKEGWES